MIVEPDFLDHWKTRMLEGMLDGDPRAPLYVLRLWAFCQQRKQWRFENLPDAAILGICHYEKNPRVTHEEPKLVNALTQSGFLVRINDGFEVKNWDEYNATLVRNWSNGKLGGRPQKNKPNDNPRETQTPKNDNPRETQDPVFDNPQITEKRREEKRREEGTPKSPFQGDGHADIRAFRVRVWAIFRMKPDSGSGQAGLRRAWKRMVVAWDLESDPGGIPWEDLKTLEAGYAKSDKAPRGCPLAIRRTGPAQLLNNWDSDVASHCRHQEWLDEHGGSGLPGMGAAGGGVVDNPFDHPPMAIFGGGL